MEEQVKHELLLTGTGGGVVCSSGVFDTERQAKLKIDDALRECPGATGWRIVKTIKTVVAEGKGPLQVRQSGLEPSGLGRW